MKVVTNYTVDTGVSSIYISGWSNTITVSVNCGNHENIGFDLSLKQAESLVEDLNSRINRIKQQIVDEMKEKEKENVDI